MMKTRLFLLSILVLALAGASASARERSYYGWLRNCEWPKTLLLDFVVDGRHLSNAVIVEQATLKSIRFARPIKHEYTKGDVRTLNYHSVRILEAGSFKIRSTQFKVSAEGVFVNGKRIPARDEAKNPLHGQGTVIYRDGAVCNGIIMTFPYADWQADGTIPRCFAPHPQRVHSR
ncbi:MAG: hypothetical protein LBF51_01855 [Zoogloeaceae bacterium]|jgi:hypothetical protein|nr:hypothetical protein [Zoogloeaceae bacterium]